MPKLEEAWRFQADGPVGAVAITPDGEYAATGSWDTNVYLFDEGGALQWKYRTTDHVGAVALSPGADLIVSGSYDKNVYSLNRSGRLQWRFRTDGAVRAVALVGSEAVAAGTGSGTVYLLDKRGGLVWKKDMGDRLAAISSDREGKHLLAVTGSGKAVLFDRAGQVRWEADAGAPAQSAAYLPDGTSLIGTADGTLNFYDRTGRRTAGVPLRNPIRAVSVTLDGAQITVACHRRLFAFLDGKGEVLATARAAVEVRAAAVSEGAVALLVGGPGGEVVYFRNPFIIDAALASMSGDLTGLPEAVELVSKVERAKKEGDLSAAAGILQRMGRLASEPPSEKALADAVAEAGRRLKRLSDDGADTLRAERLFKRAKALLETEEGARAATYLAACRRRLNELSAPPEKKVAVKPKPEETPAPAAPAGPDVQRELERVRKRAEELAGRGLHTAPAEETLAGAGKKARSNRDEAQRLIREADDALTAAEGRGGELLVEVARLEEEAGALDEGTDTVALRELIDGARNAVAGGEYDTAAEFLGQADEELVSLRRQARARSRPLARPSADMDAEAPVQVKHADEGKCFSCGKDVKPGWRSCPFCRQKLK